MAKRWYYKDENGNKVPVPQYKINADDYYTKAMSDSRYYEKSATDTMLDSKVSKTDIVQSTGTSTTAVMSQKAVSDALSIKADKTELENLIINTDKVLEKGKSQKDINDFFYKKLVKKVEPSLSWTNGEYVQSTASSDSKIVNGGTDFSITGYIEIIAGATAIAKGVQGYKNIDSYPINFYDANKKWVGCSEDVKGDYDFTNIIPDTAVYVVLSQYETADYPLSGVSLVFENKSDIPSVTDVEDIVNNAVEPLQALKESAISVQLTQDDIDPISCPSYIVDNGNVKNATSISAGGANFLLLKEDITAIEFTIGSLWDGDRFEMCFGYGYDGDNICHASAPLIAPNDYFIVGSVGSTEPATMLAQDQREKPIGIASVGDRCMVEIVLGKYICGYIWKNDKWDYWFMLNPTNVGSLCNPENTRLRYGWNKRIGIGLSVTYASASANTVMMNNVKILSRNNTPLEHYHNVIRMGRNESPRKWLAIGDSITAYDALNGWGYVGYASRRNMLDVINCGNSGWTMCDTWQKHASFPPYAEIPVDWEEKAAELDDNDIVTIFLGTNDFHYVGRKDIGSVPPYRYETTLGTTDSTREDAKDPHTTLGCLRLMIEKILEVRSSLRIIVFAPFLRMDMDYPRNSENMTIREFSEAICSVAKEYGLEHYNLCDYMGMNPKSILSLTNDNLHPNQKGGERLGELIAKWIVV